METAEKMPSIKQILAKGKVSFRVRRAGIIQKQEFVVKKGIGPGGEYPYLFLDKFIDLSELLRVSRECGLPVTAKNGNAFPPGKMAKDFVRLLK